MKKLFLSLLVISVFILFSVYVFAGSITIQWDANTEPDLAGYCVHYGSSPGEYTERVDVGNVTTYCIEGLIPDTYYIVVTAYDTSDLESEYSNEVSGEVKNLPPGNPVGCKVVDIIND